MVHILLLRGMRNTEITASDICEIEHFPLGFGPDPPTISK